MSRTWRKRLVNAARQSMVRFVFGCVLLCAGGLFLIAGIGLMTWGVYALLTPAAGAIGAAVRRGRYCSLP